MATPESWQTNSTRDEISDESAYAAQHPELNLLGLLNDARALAKHGEHWQSDGILEFPQAPGVLKVAAKTAEPVMIHSVQKASHVVNTAMTQFDLTMEGLVKGMVADPVNGLTQLVNHAAGTHISRMQANNEKQLDSSVAGKIGEFSGITADAIALSIGTAGVADYIGLGAAGGWATTATTGALMAGVFTPTSDHDFWKQRGLNALFAASTGMLNKGVDSVFTHGAAELHMAIPAPVKQGFDTLASGLNVAVMSDAKSIIQNGKHIAPGQLLVTGLEAMGRRLIGPIITDQH